MTIDREIIKAWVRLSESQKQKVLAKMKESGLVAEGEIKKRSASLAAVLGYVIVLLEEKQRLKQKRTESGLY